LKIITFPKTLPKRFNSKNHNKQLDNNPLNMNYLNKIIKKLITKDWINTIRSSCFNKKSKNTFLDIKITITRRNKINIMA